jgi:protease-4
MKKFFLGLGAGILLSGLFGFLLLVSLSLAGSNETTMTGDSLLVLRLEGGIPEKPRADMPFPFLGGSAPPTVTDVWRSLKKAAVDNRIKGIALMPRDLAAGWGKLQEMRSGLLEYKKSGKPLFVYLRTPRTPEYYLATAADQIYMVPQDYLDMKGLRAEITYFKGAFDKLGVNMEAEHAGKYKDALDTFTRTNMSPETREVYNAILDGLYGHLIETIGAARKKKPEEVANLLDTGPFLSNQAVSAGLVDRLLFEDEFDHEVKNKLGKELKRVGLATYSKTRVEATEGKHRIAVIVGEGAIVRGGSTPNSFEDDEQITVANMVKLFRQVGEDKNIEGVILRVDSPGGDAVASDEILREAKLLSKKKPMVISMSDVAASGGYYISMTGDPVIAYPNTITGSIGVIHGKLNLKGLYEKIGLSKDIVQRGKNAAIDSEYFTLDKEGREKLREGVDSIYKTFVSLVAEGRKKKYEQIHDVAQGRVWLGAQARDRALVDETGGLDRAIELVKDRAKIGKAESVRLIVYPPKQTFIEQLLARPAQDVSMDTVIRRELREWTGGMPVELFRQGNLLALMPYRIEIR